MTGPVVSVVVATRDRQERLTALLASLRDQTLGAGQFEVVVVDDGSTDGTPALLAEEEARGTLRLRAIRREHSAGPAIARDEGWRAAHGALVAFTDDDCVASPQWLERLVAAAAEHPGDVVQGSVGPIAAEAHRLSPFARTIVVDGPGPPWETCNIAYPRELLERLDGFDRERFPLPGGEDTDLAWRAVEAGRRVHFVPEARVEHAVIVEGPGGILRYAWHWHRTIPLFAIHPELRRRQLHRGLFWAPYHEHLLRFLLALVLPRRAWPLSLLLARPYADRLVRRRSGPLLAPFILATDLVELAGVIRGAIRDRVPIL